MSVLVDQKTISSPILYTCNTTKYPKPPYIPSNGRFSAQTSVLCDITMDRGFHNVCRFCTWEGKRFTLLGEVCRKSGWRVVFETKRKGDRMMHNMGPWHLNGNVSSFQEGYNCPAPTTAQESQVRVAMQACYAQVHKASFPSLSDAKRLCSGWFCSATHSLCKQPSTACTGEETL